MVCYVLTEPKVASLVLSDKPIKLSGSYYNLWIKPYQHQLWHTSLCHLLFLQLVQNAFDVLNVLQHNRLTVYGDRFSSCQVIHSQFGLAIHQNDHQARRRFVEWAQKEIAVVPDFHQRTLFSDEAHFWLNGYVNKQNCRIWSEANPQVYVETPLHPEKLTVWCALWAGGILLQKR
ncbi:uncharacterized protein TNCV_2935151 [Trichonephila clavipes]|nr:uncharacterized protein TNCV_2935151 [Trichonephila clavipes]